MGKTQHQSLEKGVTSYHYKGSMTLAFDLSSLSSAVLTDKIAWGWI